MKRSLKNIAGFWRGTTVESVCFAIYIGHTMGLFIGLYLHFAQHRFWFDTSISVSYRAPQRLRASEGKKR